MSKLNLKTTRPPAPAPSASGLKPAPPIPKPAGVIPYDHLTPEEKAELSQLGWDAGRAVPANMADIIAAASAAEEEAVREHLAGPIADRVQSVPLEQLPEEKRQEVLRHVAEAARQMAALEASQAEAPIVQGMDPGVRAAYERSRRINEASRKPAEPPRPENPKQAPTPPPAPPTTPTPPPAEEPPTNRTGAADPTHCPRCGHDARQPLDVEPTDRDKQLFLVELLSLSDKARFRKTVELFDGQLRIGFRAITTAERNAISRQVADDARRGELGEDNVLAMTIAADARTMEYTMLLSIDHVEAAGMRRYEAPDSLADVEYDSVDATGAPIPGASALRAIRDHLLEDVLRSDSLRQVVAQEFLKFHQLRAVLTARVGHGDFFKGIGAPSA